MFQTDNLSKGLVSWKCITRWVYLLHWESFIY